MDETKTFPCLAGIFCDVAACCTLYRIFDRSEDGSLLGPRLLPWLLLTFAVYGALRLFLRKARPLPAVVGLHILLLGAQLSLLLLFCSTFGEPANAVMAGLMILFTGGRACVRCFSPPTAMHSIRQLETCVALLLLAVWFRALTPIPAAVCLPPLAAVGAAFTALIAQRLEGARGAASGSKVSGLTTVGLVLTALALVMLLFMLFFSAPLGEGVLWLWQTGVAAVRWILGLLYRLLFWFASLFPDPEPGEAMPEPFTFKMPEQGEQAQGNPLVGAVVLVLLAAGVAALCVRLLWRLRQWRIGGKSRRVPSRQSVSRTRFRLSAFFLRILSALGARARLLLLQFLQRNTPAGVCAAIERSGGLLGAGRRRGETHSAYLRRVGSLTVGQDAGLAASLEALAGTLERGFYADGPMPPLPGAAARSLRRRASLALRRRLLPDVDALSRLGRRLLPSRFKR